MFILEKSWLGLPIESKILPAEKKSKKKPTLKDQVNDLNQQVSDEKDKFLRLFACRRLTINRYVFH